MMLQLEGRFEIVCRKLMQVAGGPTEAESL